MRVRFFAGAAEAAGVDEITVDAQGLTVADVVARLGRGNRHLAEVLEASSLLADGACVRDRAASALGVGQLDVLPPFAGG